MNISVESVLLLGATGLVGGECLRLLTEDAAFERIVVLSRKPPRTALTARIEWHRIDFEDPASFEGFLGVNAVICALGTTIRKAGSQAAFRRVDFDYPLLFARLARERGAHHFLLVSAAGANTKSRIFYSRVKGELEAALSELAYPALTIFRPSLLLGHRAEHRRGELFGQKVLGPLQSLLPKSVRPIPASQVAAAIVREARNPEARGSRLFTNADLL